MLNKVNISSSHYEVEDDIRKYINKKVGRIDRFIPRHARETAHADVKLVERKTKSDKYECEVILHLPEQIVAAKADTINMFAAVDIVETKLKNQLKKYKAKHGGDHKDHHSKLRRLLRRKPPIND
jgi:ribosomal subunit interface protein